MRIIATTISATGMTMMELPPGTQMLSVELDIHDIEQLTVYMLADTTSSERIQYVFSPFHLGAEVEEPWGFLGLVRLPESLVHVFYAEADDTFDFMDLL